MYFTDTELVELKIALLDRADKLHDATDSKYNIVWVKRCLDLYDRLDAEYQQRKVKI